MSQQDCGRADADSLPTKVNFVADQGAICHVDNPKSACGQTDSACGQLLSPMWPALRVGVNTL